MRATGADLVDFCCCFVFCESVAIAPSKSMTRVRPVHLFLLCSQQLHQAYDPQTLIMPFKGIFQ